MEKKVDLPIPPHVLTFGLVFVLVLLLFGVVIFVSSKINGSSVAALPSPTPAAVLGTETQSQNLKTDSTQLLSPNPIGPTTPPSTKPKTTTASTAPKVTPSPSPSSTPSPSPSTSPSPSPSPENSPSPTPSPTPSPSPSPSPSESPSPSPSA